MLFRPKKAGCDPLKRVRLVGRIETVSPSQFLVVTAHPQSLGQWRDTDNEFGSVQPSEPVVNDGVVDSGVDDQPREPLVSEGGTDSGLGGFQPRDVALIHAIADSCSGDQMRSVFVSVGNTSG